MKGTMNLARDNNKLSGTWSGDLGQQLPVRGTWRDGYVELAFTGTWRDNAASTPTRLGGWIDNDSGRGRMKVEGQWAAQRHKESRQTAVIPPGMRK